MEPNDQREERTTSRFIERAEMGKILISIAVVGLALAIAFAVYVITL